MHPMKDVVDIFQQYFCLVCVHSFHHFVVLPLNKNIQFQSIGGFVVGLTQLLKYEGTYLSF